MNDNSNLKVKAMKYFMIFLALMLVLTFTARGIYAYRLPKVTYVNLKNTSINHTVKCDGTIKTTKEIPVTVLPELLVEEVCVKKGDTVEEGDVLLKFDKTFLEEYISKLKNSLRTDELTRADYYSANAWNSAEILTNSIEEKQKNIDRYQQLLENNSQVKSERNIKIMEVKINPGEITTNTACLLTADSTDNLYFSAPVTKEQFKMLSTVTAVSLSFHGGKDILENCTISSIVESSKESDETYDVVIPIVEPVVSVGDIGTLSVTISSPEGYDCVPVESVNTNGAQAFIYIVETSKGFLGEDYHVVKKSVSIVDQNDDYVALENSGLTDEDKIVLNKTKELHDGDIVRFLQK